MHFGVTTQRLRVVWTPNFNITSLLRLDSSGNYYPKYHVTPGFVKSAIVPDLLVGMLGPNTFVALKLAQFGRGTEI